MNILKEMFMLDMHFLKILESKSLVKKNAVNNARQDTVKDYTWKYIQWTCINTKKFRRSENRGFQYRRKTHVH